MAVPVILAESIEVVVIRRVVLGDLYQAYWLIDAGAMNELPQRRAVVVAG